MDTKPHFFHLPNHIREQIYRYYVFVDGGYVYNPETHKLRAANGGFIDLSLMYTCRDIFFDMTGLPLRTNTITFYPFYPEESLYFAYLQGIMLLQTHHQRCEMFRSAKRCYTEKVKAQFCEIFPQLMSIFDDFSADLRLENIGHAPSQVYDAMGYALKLASSHPNYEKDLAHLKYQWGDTMKLDLDRLRKMYRRPWEVITPNDIDHPEIFHEFRGGLHPSIKLTKYGFSAAALARRYLDSISLTVFANMRRIILEEDHPAVAMSACHARGLIPFCRFHGLLRIERRVHLWKNIFVEGALARSCKYIPICPPIRSIDVLDARLSESMTRSVALWTIEAQALIEAGMPVKSFSLVFHGDMTPEKCSEVFQNVIKRDATWQAALEENARLGLLKPLDFFQRPCNTFPFDTFENFPQALEDIANNRNPIVRCDFDIGEYSASDAKQLAAERREWTLDQWRLRWLDVGLVNWNDMPSLLEKIPLLKELLQES